jgi:hypothetical protein
VVQVGDMPLLLLLLLYLMLLLMLVKGEVKVVASESQLGGTERLN